MNLPHAPVPVALSRPPEPLAPLEIRSAQASDVEAAVPLIYSSGPAAFDFVFSHDRPGEAQKFLAYVFTRGDGEFGHRNHIVAVRQGAVCGVGSGFDGAHSLAFTVAAARQILAFYGPLRGAGVIARGLRTETIIRPPRRGQYYVCHLGVAEDERGGGIGTALIDALLDVSRRKDSHEAALDVAVSNPRAQALYQRLGFRVIATRNSRLANRHGSVGDHRRMVRSL